VPSVQTLNSPLTRAISLLRQNAGVSGPLWTASLVLDRLRIPALGWWPDRRVPEPLLTSQTRAILAAWGMPAEAIEATLPHLLYADLHGIDSHGVAMLRKYSDNLAARRLVIDPVIRIVSESESTALIDGGGGLGHMPAAMAMELAIAKCRATGAAAVTVGNSGHFGAAGSYTSMAGAAGLIGIAATNAPPAVVPSGGVEAKLGTNPIAFAAPAARNKPFHLDMATSAAPIGRLMTAWRKGRSIPAGWAVDEKGREVTNPRRAALLRLLTPLGSYRDLANHKGYGLGAMVEILSSLLPRIQPGEPRQPAHPHIGHFFLAIDPDRFRPRGDFQHDVDHLIDNLRATRPADPARPVLVAGDPEYAAFEDRRARGIPLARPVVEDLRWVCHSCGADFLLDSPRVASRT
jgi:LDH2 family malate/lactate/ureidoglycolate dehydrogenase